MSKKGTITVQGTEIILLSHQKGIWEQMNNPDFNLTGFREVKMDNKGLKRLN